MGIAEKYTLLLAFDTVRRIETSARRAEVFESIAKQKVTVRFVYGLYRALACIPFLQTMMIMGFGIKCIMTYRARCSSRNVDVLGIAPFDNEVRTIRHVMGMAPEISHRILTPSKTNFFCISNWLFLLRGLSGFGRAYRVARRLRKNYAFMPACRCFSVIVLYAYFLQRLPDDAYKSVIVASNYAPEPLALAAAAHKKGKSVAFTNHANPSPQVTALHSSYADLNILSGVRAAQVYGITQDHLHVIYIGLPVEQRPLGIERLCDREAVTIGFFLTGGGTNFSKIKEIMKKFDESGQQVSFVLRPHPNSLTHENYEKAFSNMPMAIESDVPLQTHIKRCDLVFCGNSSAVLETLKGGCPVIYVPELDGLGFDYNGFVESGLVPVLKQGEANVLDSVTAFYEKDAWQEVMASYDGAYNKRSKDISAAVHFALCNLVQSKQDSP